MSSEAALMEVERRVRDIGDRFGSLADADEKLFELLEEAEIWLSRVDQSPQDSIYTALRPTMAALIKKELLDHDDPAVSLAVASCLTEVTRITAPEAPYDDDVMKDVFTRVVRAFAKLDDMDSPTFARRVAMLETVAKVRSCVLMLDLECDDLILDMFHHFLKTVSPGHQENVISSMETIMMFVINESEPVHPDLASCLLRNVKKEKKESFPTSFGLAERVIGLCPEKLQPAFTELLQGTPIDDYSDVVTSLLQGSSDTDRNNNVDASGKDTDGLTDADALVNNVKTPNGRASSKLKPELLSDGKPAKVSGKQAKRSKVVTGNESPAASGELSPGTNDGDNKLALEACSRPAVDKPKRGRPPAAKSNEKKPVGKSQGSGLESKKGALGGNSGGRTAKRPAKDDIKSSSRKGGVEKSSNKKTEASLKLHKEDSLSDEDTDEDLSLKDIVSPKSSTKTGKTKAQPGDSGASKRKHAREAEEVPQSKKNKKLDASLVGARIKVWWPDDKEFYNGAVSSFDASSKKHQVVYDDGDVENLLLKDERWEFIDKEQDNYPDAASDTPRGRRGRGSMGQQTKEVKTETPDSGKQDNIDNRDPPKKRGRPKGVRPSSSMSNDDSPMTSARGRWAERDAEGEPKAGNFKSAAGRSRSIGKTKDDPFKAEAVSTKSANKSKDEAGSKQKDASTPRAAHASKTNGLKAKRKLKEEEVESSEEEEQGSAKTSIGKRRRRKIR